METIRSPGALLNLFSIMLLLPEQMVNLGMAEAADITRREQLLSFPTPQSWLQPRRSHFCQKDKDWAKTLHMYLWAPL